MISKSPARPRACSPLSRPMPPAPYCAYRALSTEEMWWLTITGTAARTGSKTATHRRATAPAPAVHANQPSTAAASPTATPSCTGPDSTDPAGGADNAFSPAATSLHGPAASHQGTLHVIHPGGGALQPPSRPRPSPGAGALPAARHTTSVSKRPYMRVRPQEATSAT